LQIVFARATNLGVGEPAGALAVDDDVPVVATGGVPR
jgi:hypothetical protein